jgi:hypothetical protein
MVYDELNFWLGLLSLKVVRLNEFLVRLVRLEGSYIIVL